MAIGMALAMEPWLKEAIMLRPIVAQRKRALQMHGVPVSTVNTASEAAYLFRAVVSCSGRMGDSLSLPSMYAFMSFTSLAWRFREASRCSESVFS